jgi:hypothetical protein
LVSTVRPAARMVSMQVLSVLSQTKTFMVILLLGKGIKNNKSSPVVPAGL